MASKLVGGQKMTAVLRRLPATVQQEVATGIDRSIRRVQRTPIMLVPKRTSNLAKVLAAKAAIGKRKKGLEAEFGFRTKRLAKKGWYAHFVEYGTKGYTPGQARFSGFGKRGPRYRIVRKPVPARPAQPFLRPALEMNRRGHTIEMRESLRRAVRKARRV